MILVTCIFVALLVWLCLALWVVWLGPKKMRCEIYDLHDPLRTALLRLAVENDGYVRVDAGKNFVQFVPLDNGVLVDVPAQQLVDLQNADALLKLGFKYSNNSDAYQKNVEASLEATLVAFEVLYTVFKLRDVTRVSLISYYRKTERPRPV